MSSRSHKLIPAPRLPASDGRPASPASATWPAVVAVRVSEELAELQADVASAANATRRTQEVTEDACDFDVLVMVFPHCCRRLESSACPEVSDDGQRRRLRFGADPLWRNEPPKRLKQGCPPPQATGSASPAARAPLSAPQDREHTPLALPKAGLPAA